MRTQKVKVNNSYSETLHVHAGVPQCSIHGPLLFLIYINDIGLSTGSIDIDLYADDSTVYKSDFDIGTIETKLQDNLNFITSWCRLNNMSLHPSKSKCMLLSTKYKIKQARELRLSIENSMIENVEVHKLGSV